MNEISFIDICYTSWQDVYNMRPSWISGLGSGRPAEEIVVRHFKGVKIVKKEMIG